MDAARLSRPVLILTGAALAVLAALGIAESLRHDGMLPDFRVGYPDHVRSLLARGDKDGAVEQMRLIVTLEGHDEGVLNGTLPAMALLARETGRREDELFALRTMARRSADEPWVHERLVVVLLEAPAPGEAEIREALGHAEHLATRWPEAASSWWSLARVAQVMGLTGQTEEFLRRAQAIDPSVRLPPQPQAAAAPRSGT